MATTESKATGRSNNYQDIYRRRYFALLAKFKETEDGKKTPHQPGIYLGTRNENGKTIFYVGQAKDLFNRRFDYFRVQSSLDPPKRRFTASLKKHKDYKYQVIENCTLDQLNEREKYWIDYYYRQPNYLTRNESLIGGRDQVQSNYKRIDKIREKFQNRVKKDLLYLDLKQSELELNVSVKRTKKGDPAAISVKHFEDFKDAIGIGGTNEVQQETEEHS